jgi:hypothetical protein
LYAVAGGVELIKPRNGINMMDVWSDATRAREKTAQAARKGKRKGKEGGRVKYGEWVA